MVLIKHYYIMLELYENILIVTLKNVLNIFFFILKLFVLYDIVLSNTNKINQMLNLC